MNEDPGPGPRLVPLPGSAEAGSDGAGPSSAPLSDEGRESQRDGTPAAIAHADEPVGLGGPRDAAGPPNAGRPPGAGIFSLEGRPAPGLYVAAWLLALVGFGLLVVAGGAATSASSGGGIGLWAVGLLFAALVVFTLAFAAAAGYQVLARANRPAQRYRGPSPLILFAVVLFSVTLAVGLLSAVGWIAPESQSLGALVVVLLTTLAYLGSIWLFVVRTGVLRWPEMGWPTRWRAPRGQLAGDALAGVTMMVPAYLVTILIGAVVATLLGVQLPSALPTPRSVPDALATVLAGVIVAPVGEEAFFRGLSLTAWWRDLGLRAALLRATLFFAAAHILNVTASNASEGLRMALLQFVVILPVGLALGWLFSQRGIVASIAGHMTFNAIAVSLLLTSGAIRA